MQTLYNVCIKKLFPIFYLVTKAASATIYLGKPLFSHNMGIPKISEETFAKSKPKAEKE